MAKKDEKLFRGHLGGFNKSDVNEYIRETDRTHADIVASLTDELNSAKAKLAETEKAADALKADISCAKAEAELIKAQKAGLESEIDSLRAESDVVKDEKAALESRNTELMSEIGALRAKLDKLESKKADASSPISTLEKVRSRLSAGKSGTSDEMIRSARDTAQRIISAAERECEAKRAECDAAVARIRTQTEGQAEFIRTKLAQTAGSFLSNVGNDLTESIESCIREINSCLSDMESEIKTLLSKMESRSGEMNDRIAYYKGYLSEGIESTISKIDTTAADTAPIKDDKND